MANINRVKHRTQKSIGQALVEFAFVLPILLLLMVAIIDFGIVFYTQMAVSNAAWEGARAGATIIDPSKGDQEITGAVHSAAYGLDPASLVIDIDPTQDEPPRNLSFPEPRGAALTVTLQYQVRLTFPQITLPITGRAVTRMEYQNP
ncbi:MAG: pilus assembly protein [Anaerolineales bacterium]|nr:pilus assembly protein [Anaerolineales bacterium]